MDRNTNTITPLRRRKFSELGFREREHLQEWIAKNPNILGEELLIIQKEFDGWAETRERIDLLALDKQGRLVVIENKLDDSGRDVTWQAMKYAAYCSSLTKTEIVAVFQAYLDRYQAGQDSEENLTAFFDEEFETLELNEGFKQRMILVGARFRPEVTATCLWLINRGINVKCIEVTPYGSDDKLYLSVDQIIPPPGAEDYMVKVSSKEQEEQSTQGSTKLRHATRRAFFTNLLEGLSGEAMDVYGNINPGKDHWLAAGSGVSSVSYQFHFLKKALRAELCISRSRRAENKFIFDELESRKTEIEHKIGTEMFWLRLNDHKMSRIGIEIPFDAYNQSNWTEAVDWMNTAMNSLIAAVREPLNAIGSSRDYLNAEEEIELEE
jgi:hypothetical protein